MSTLRMIDLLFATWSLIFNQLFIGLAVVLSIVFFLSKAKLFRTLMLKSVTSSTEKMAMAVFFGGVGLLGTYIGVPTDDGFANTRAVGVIVAGLVGGRATGLGAGAIAGFHRYYLGGFSATGSAVATLLEGLIAGMLRHTTPPGKEKWPYALVLGFILEASHMAFLMVVNRPYEQALHFVASIAPPMLLMNPLGIATLIAILENIFREQERIEGSAARLTLQIASNTLTYLRKGLNQQSAEKTAQVIYGKVNNLAAVVVTNRTEVLSFVGIGLDHHTSTILTKSTLDTIATGEYTLAQTRREIGCPRQDCPLGSKIAAPLKDQDEVLGTLVLYKLEENSIKPFEIELIQGLAQLISTQLEVSKGERQTALLAQAEIKALQAQINPHFLFNALNTIVHYCRKQPETARGLLIHLANYYRNNLSVSDNLISLDREIQHVNDYVKIEAARFEGKLQVVYAIPDDCKPLVPPLIVQPIVENAVKHGLYPKSDGGIVTISAQVSGNKIVLVVEDNGVGMQQSQIQEVLKPDPGRQNIGLCNVDSRLKSLYGDEYGLTIESEANVGTRVMITLPREGGISSAESDYRR
ncbi:MAG: sensor histidine kinase [Negativicutes bacterium]|nr:sensor histidine kinase [Negativicutes bacterium]